MKKKHLLIGLLSALMMGCSVAYILTATPPAPIPPTPTIPQVMCTPPACEEDESYHCPDDCPGGCGIVCATHTPGGPTATPMIMCTPPACTENESYYCPDTCPGGCGTVCATHTPAPQDDWWQPHPGLSFHIQYTGDLDLNQPVDVYNIDLFDTSTETIAQLHSAGKKVICYFSAGSYEGWRPDRFQFPAEIIGNPLEGWEGENWLDIRQIDLLTPIIEGRLALASSKGCDAVDPDNVDAYTNDSGFDLSYEDQLIFNRWLADQAHNWNMAIGLKNDLQQIPDLFIQFDFAINEECFSYQECGAVAPFIDSGKAVFVIEYGNDAGEYCAIANASQFMMARKNLDLDAWNIPCWKQ